MTSSIQLSRNRASKLASSVVGISLALQHPTGRDTPTREGSFTMTDDEPGRLSGELTHAAHPDAMSLYLGLLGNAYRWGFCLGILHRRLGRLHSKSSPQEASPEEIDDLLAAWQMLRSFPVERPSPLAAA
jgi:hypothetical protein